MLIWGMQQTTSKVIKGAPFRVAIICLALVSTTALARADDSYVDGISGSVKPMRPHKTIRMVSERVDMWLPKGKVRAQFIFRNEGPATVVQMGFPECGTYPIRGRKRTAFHYFRSFVDGKRFRVKREVQTGDDAWGYQYWWVKKVPFAKGQTRKVVCEYAANPDDMGDGWFAFDYRLDTGGSWKGKIGEAVIVAHFARPEAQTIDSVTPDPTSRTAGKIVWLHRNFKPEQGDDWSLIDVTWQAKAVKRPKGKPGAAAHTPSRSNSSRKALPQTSYPPGAR